MATTINIESKQVTATVAQQEVVANSNTLNYSTSQQQPPETVANLTITNYVADSYSTTSITTPNKLETPLSIKITGIDTNTVPTTIRSRSESDLVTITDSVLRQVIFRRTYLDPVNISDAFSRVVDYKRSITIGVRVSQENTTFKIDVKKSHLVNASETTAKTIRPVYADQVNTAEFITKSFSSRLVDTVNILEIISLTPKLLKTDSITATDTSFRYLSWYRTFIETISVTDDYLGNANIDDDQYATFIKAVLISAQVTDFVIKQIKPLKLEQVNFFDGKYITISVQKTNNINVSDLFAKVVAYKRIQADQTNIADVNLKTLQKSQADSANISDLRFITAKLSKTENINVAETINKLTSTIYLKNINVSEFITKNYSKLNTELINIADPVFKTVRLPKTDNFQVTDQFSKFVAYGRLFVDQINITDDYQGAANIDDDQYVTFGKALIDLINLPEYIAKNISKPLATDQVNILETKFANIKLLKTDAFTIGDLVSKTVQIKPSIFVNVNEQQYKSISTSFLDNTTVTDNIRKLSNLLKLDNVNITDSFSRTVNYLRTLIDQINVTDDYLGNANVDDDQYVAFGKRIIDQVNIAENILKNITKSVADTVNTTETKFVNIALLKVDSWTVTEQPFKNIGINRIEVVNTAEIFTRTVNYLRTIQESGIFDYLMLENLSDFLLLETGDFLITEAMVGLSVSDIIQISRAITLADQFNVLDTLLKRTGKILTDQINTTDNFTRTINYLRTFTDQINTTDDYLGNANIDDDQYVTFGKRIVDIVNFAENSYKSTTKILQDIVNVSDQRYLNAKTIKTDQTNSTDTINLFKYRNQFNSEQIYVSSSGTAYLQDYFQDPTYVENGYVGTITTFT